MSGGKRRRSETAIHVPEESNVLLNPSHPGFSHQWIKAGPIEFFFDSRLTAP